MRKIFITAFAVTAIASHAFAAELSMDTVLGTTLEEVEATLTDMGYEVRKSEIEDGELEVYIVKDGKMSEVYVSPTTGSPTKIKTK